MRCPGTGAPWGEGWGPWGQLHYLSLVLGEAEVGLQPWCWAWTLPLSTSLPSRNEAVGADGVARGSQSSALTSASCPWPHRPELLSPSSCIGSCICLCPVPSQLVSPLCSVPHSPAGASNTPINVSEKSLCTGQSPLGLPQPGQHCLHHGLPVPWACAPGWGVPRGCWGDCAVPFHADSCHLLCEPSSAMDSRAELWWFLVQLAGASTEGSLGPQGAWTYGL